MRLNIPMESTADGLVAGLKARFASLCIAQSSQSRYGAAVREEEALQPRLTICCPSQGRLGSCRCPSRDRRRVQGTMTTAYNVAAPFWLFVFLLSFAAAAQPAANGAQRGLHDALPWPWGGAGCMGWRDTTIPQSRVNSARAAGSAFVLTKQQILPVSATFASSSRSPIGEARNSQPELQLKLNSAWIAGVARIALGAFLLLPFFAAQVAAPMAFASKGWADPFFDGWFIRLIDRGQNMSCAVIVGSFRHAGAGNFSEHYIALSYSAANMARRGAESPDELQSVHVFPDPGDVKITIGGVEMGGFLHETDWRAPATGRSPDFVWHSMRYGGFSICGSHLHLNFTLPGAHSESVSFNADLKAPVRWGKRRKAGPEGWLGSVGFLLPCRYFVQSLASPCCYSLCRTRASLSDQASACTSPRPRAQDFGGTRTSPPPLPPPSVSVMQFDQRKQWQVSLSVQGIASASRSPCFTFLASVCMYVCYVCLCLCTLAHWLTLLPVYLANFHSTAITPTRTWKRR
jgi:hypothetical protein